MPWTNIAINCTDAFTSAVLASPVFHNVHDDLPISFYCLPVDPDMPWMFAVYTGLTGLAEPAEFKDAALTKLLADDVVIQMARDDHSNVPGEHSPAFVIRVALNLAQVSTCTVVHRAYNRRAIPTIAHRLLIPPISKNWDAIQRLQNHLMSAGFTIDRDVLRRALFDDDRQPLTKKSLLGKPKNRAALLAYVASTNRFPRYAPSPT
ncbi:hypothetical protein B0H11DRAFT_2372770 [Mycena galericulata]|nr:hypothetical protein B0H11DRAFT_2372770 [Mycena galericulata]